MQIASPGNRLRELRLSRTPQPKLRELAHLVERDQSTYWRYEEGATPLPMEAARRLAGFYDVSVEHLMGWDEDREVQGAAA